MEFPAPEHKKADRSEDPPVFQIISCGEPQRLLADSDRDQGRSKTRSCFCRFFAHALQECDQRGRQEIFFEESFSPFSVAVLTSDFHIGILVDRACVASNNPDITPDDRGRKSKGDRILEPVSWNKIQKHFADLFISRFPFLLGTGNSPPMSATGILLIVSGPSGSGKTTLCRRLANENRARYSISCTTRAPRPGETDGRDYHFLSKEEFERRLSVGDFLEYAMVHGNFYGTLKSEVSDHLEAGTHVVMDIDVQGAGQVRACGDPQIQKALVDLFVMPPTYDELRVRLTGRGTDSEEIIELRMKNALEEIEHWRSYTYRLLSLTPEEDYRRFEALVAAEELRVSRAAEIG
jgi:guanylate kinase